jgi:hypothetical protein
MTAMEILKRVSSYDEPYWDKEIEVVIRNDETGDYLKVRDVWVNASGKVMMEVGGND